MESLINKTRNLFKDSEVETDAVLLSVRNETGLPLQIVSWPCHQALAGPYQLSVCRGKDFVSDSLPSDGAISTVSDVDIGRIRAVHVSLLDATHHGWLFFDLVRPDHTRVHLQAFVRLKKDGIAHACLGRLDLDSHEEDPQPSGEFGSAEYSGPKANQITFVVTADVKDILNTTIDTEKEYSKYTGKGVEVSSYVSHKNALLSFLIGREARYHEYSSAPTVSEIKYSKHSLVSLISRYVGFWASRDRVPVADGHIKINPATGYSDGALSSTYNSKAVFGEDITFQYGFSDQGSFRNDQIYAYVTPNYENWLGDLTETDERWLDAPFSTLCLSGAHDCGMLMHLDADLLDLIQQGKLSDTLGNKTMIDYGTPLLHFLIKALEDLRLKPERVINNIANTQKDSIADQLRVGTRFFDMRPGYKFTDAAFLKKGELHHMHAMVPGCRYIDFLTDILEFLAQHPKEIVFVEIKNDGFVLPKDVVKEGNVVALSMVPTVEELDTCLAQARSKVSVDAGRIKIGSQDDLSRKIGELLRENTRLIVVDRVHREDAWDRSDSYDHQAYNTIDSATIIAMLEKTHQQSGQAKPASGAIYQLQATPTAGISLDVAASITYSDASSLLVFTKALQDRHTYPWIAAHTFTEPGNVIFLNDFVDSVLVERAIAKSQERFITRLQNI